MEKKWLQNSDNHFERPISRCSCCHKKKRIYKIKASMEKIQKTMLEDGHWYSNQVSGTFTLKYSFVRNSLSLMPKTICSKVKNHAKDSGY